MSTEKEQSRNIYGCWSTEDLVKALTVDRKNHTPFVLALMNREILRRKLEEVDTQILKAGTGEREEELSQGAAAAGPTTRFKRPDPERYGMIVCPDCKGYGRLPKEPEGFQVCPACGAFGLIKKESGG